MAAEVGPHRVLTVSVEIVPAGVAGTVPPRAFAGRVGQQEPATPAGTTRDTDPCGLRPQFLADEIAVALKLGRGSASIRLHQAQRLAAVLPETLALWQAGRIVTAANPNHPRPRANRTTTTRHPRATPF